MMRAGSVGTVSMGGQRMASEEVNTVNIPLEEYFELRQKAEMSAYLMAELGRIQGEINDVHRRIDDHEREWHRDK